MSAKGYTTKIEVENYILEDIDASFISQIDKWISSVESFIDHYTGRNFIATPEPSEGDPRYYDGSGKRELIIEDCLSISSITIDDEEVTANDWYLYPSNGLPKTKVILKSNSFTRGNQNVVITGVWGYSSVVPDDIKLAATVFMAGIIAYANDPGAKSETIGRYSVTYNDKVTWADHKQALDILDRYRKFSF